LCEIIATHRLHFFNASTNESVKTWAFPFDRRLSFLTRFSQKTRGTLANWDKKGEDNEQFLRAYTWDGKELKPSFDLDFTVLKLGRPHHMLFGATKLGANRVASLP